MTTEPEDTRIIRSWLEEGVTALPDRVLDSVLDQLPATPQRRARRPAWRLNTMATPFRLAAAAAAIGVLSVVVGIAPATNGPGTTDLVASPSPGVVSSPSPAGPVPALVTGRLVWSGGAEFSEESTVEYTIQQRLRARSARSEMSDSRLSGTVAVTDDADRFFSVPDPDFDMATFVGDVLWGDVTITNDEGSWTGTLVGTSDLSTDGRGISYIELTGAGTYEGFSAVLFERELSQSNWTWNGVIFPGDLPPDR